MSVKGAYAAKRNGEFFENLITASCIDYAYKGIAYIQKTPEPMKPVKAINRNQGRYLAVYTKKAQPDFTGTLNGGRSVVFEAKHTQNTNIAFDRVSTQQEMDLSKHLKLGAEVFILVSFAAKNFYKIPYDSWLMLKKTIGKKSLNELDLTPYRVSNDGRIIKFLG